MLETRMGGVRDIVQDVGLPHVLCFQVHKWHVPDGEALSAPRGRVASTRTHGQHACCPNFPQHGPGHGISRCRRPPACNPGLAADVLLVPLRSSQVVS